MEDQTPQGFQNPIQPAPVAGSYTPQELPQAAIAGSQKKSPNFLFLALILLILGIVGFLAVTVILPMISGPKDATLTWWGLWEDEAIVAPLISEYEAAHPGVKITYIKQSPQDYRERLTNALASGTGPDIFRFHNSWVPMMSNQLSTVPGNIYSASDFSEIFYPVATADLTTDNGIVGIPLEYDGLTLFINEDIFKSAGKETPKTWDELRTTALSLTIKDDRGVITQSGVALGRTENVDHWQEILALMMVQNRANLSTPSGELGEAALSFYTIFSSVDKVWDETLPPSTVAFAGGKLAMYFGPSWRYFEIKQQNPNLNFRTVPLPQLPKDNPSEADISYATYWVEGVASGSRNKTEAWKFLHFLSQKETLEKFYAGASTVRGIGEPYPRPEMSSLLVSHPVLGSVVQLAPNAKSWYLASRTFDGETGINSLIGQYYEDAVNAVNTGGNPKAALVTVEAGVAEVLAGYRGR